MQVPHMMANPDLKIVCAGCAGNSCNTRLRVQALGEGLYLKRQPSYMAVHSLLGIHLTKSRLCLSMLGVRGREGGARRDREEGVETPRRAQHPTRPPRMVGARTRRGEEWGRAWLRHSMCDVLQNGHCHERLLPRSQHSERRTRPHGHKNSASYNQFNLGRKWSVRRLRNNREGTKKATPPVLFQKHMRLDPGRRPGPSREHVYPGTKSYLWHDFDAANGKIRSEGWKQMDLRRSTCVQTRKGGGKATTERNTATLQLLRRKNIKYCRRHARAEADRSRWRPDLGRTLEKSTFIRTQTRIHGTVSILQMTEDRRYPDTYGAQRATFLSPIQPRMLQLASKAIRTTVSHLCPHAVEASNKTTCKGEDKPVLAPHPLPIPVLTPQWYFLHAKKCTGGAGGSCNSRLCFQMFGVSV
ncbi:hypothetical protein OF83DRAFT_1087022 [Amylostereum chailletii]|nr:hypothetical protein OF83DRAFT_1087022 [Amylostereum chailletii]